MEITFYYRTNFPAKKYESIYRKIGKKAEAVLQLDEKYDTPNQSRLSRD